MTFGFPESRYRALAVCAACACLLPEVLAQQPDGAGKHLEFSDSVSSAAPSITNVAPSESEARKDLTEAYKIKKPDSFGRSDPFAGPDMPFLHTPMPSIKSKKLMELLQKRKDWVFLEPTEKEFGLTAEAIFDIPDKETEKSEDKDMTPLQRFYFRSDDRDESATNGPSEAERPDEEEKNPLSLNAVWSEEANSRARSSDAPDQSDAPITGFFNNDSASTIRVPAGTTAKYQTFDSGKAKGSSVADIQASKAQEARMNEFKKLLDTYYPAPSHDNSSAGAGSWYDPAAPWNFSTPRPTLSSRQNSAPASSWQNPFSSLPAGGMTPGLPQPYEDLSTLSGYPSLTPALPIEEKRRLTLPEPLFIKPKTHF